MGWAKLDQHPTLLCGRGQGGQGTCSTIDLGSVPTSLNLTTGSHLSTATEQLLALLQSPWEVPGGTHASSRGRSSPNYCNHYMMSRGRVTCWSPAKHPFGEPGDLRPTWSPRAVLTPEVLILDARHEDDPFFGASVIQTYFFLPQPLSSHCPVLSYLLNLLEATPTHAGPAPPLWFPVLLVLSTRPQTSSRAGGQLVVGGKVVEKRSLGAGRAAGGSRC